jgi:hypothetical protein
MSAPFALAGSTSHTFSAWTKSSGIGGTNEPTIWVVETDSAGNVLTDSDGSALQHSITANAGTSGWVLKSETFTTDPRCARAYVYANIYKGHGTVWIDDVSVR